MRPSSLSQLKRLLAKHDYSLLGGGKNINIHRADNQVTTKQVPTHVFAMLKASTPEEIQRIALVALKSFSPFRKPGTENIYRDIANANDVPGLTKAIESNQTFKLLDYPENSSDALTQWKHKILNKMRMRIGGTKIQIQEQKNGATKTIRIPAHMLGILMSDTKEEAQRFAELALQAKAPGRTQTHKKFYNELIESNDNRSSTPGMR